MSGTRAGGQKAAASILARNPDHYRQMGHIGGSNGAGPEYKLEGEKAMGFAANPDRARLAGAKGGRARKENYRRQKSILEVAREQRNAKQN